MLRDFVGEIIILNINGKVSTINSFLISAEKGLALIKLEKLA